MVDILRMGVLSLVTGCRTKRINEENEKENGKETWKSEEMKKGKEKGQ